MNATKNQTKTVFIDGGQFEILSHLSIRNQVESWQIESQTVNEFVEAIVEHAPGVAEWIADLWNQKKEERADLKAKLSSLSDADLQKVDRFIETGGQVPAEDKEAWDAYQRERGSHAREAANG